MARRRDHRQAPAPAQALPLPVRFNAKYRDLDAWLRRHRLISALAALLLVVVIALARTFPLTAPPALGGIAVLACAALVLGYFSLGPLAGPAVAIWAAWSPLGELVLARLLGIAAPAPALAAIIGPAALFLLLAAAAWWLGRRRGWDLRGTFAVALAIALGVAPMG